MSWRRGARTGWLPLFLILAPVRLQGQPVRLDEGSFTLSIDGQRAGREQFSVQRASGAEGTVLEIRSEAAVGTRRTAMRLEADSAGTPLRYSVEERRGAEVTLRLGGQRVRGRFATVARGSTGEAAREYLLLPNAVVVEAEGFVQYALLLHGRVPAVATSLSLPRLTPVSNTQGSVQLSVEALDDVVVLAGARRPAVRWRIQPVGGDPRLVWADRDGRLLRIVLPSRGIEALRDDVPR